MLPARLPEPATQLADDSQQTIADEFMRQAASRPDAIAVIFEGRGFTYRELDQHSNRIADLLRSMGVKPETLVGVFLPRGEMLLAALLGILKAGGAYVPLDPEYPQERLSLVIADAGMRIVVTVAGSQGQLPIAPPGVTLVDAGDAAVAGRHCGPMQSGASGANLAYVIYTSGSTGAPKGVMVEHRNVINFFAGMDRVIASDSGVWLAVTSVAFDISVLELLWTLTRGFTILLHGDHSASIADEIEEYGVTHLQMTPSLARMLTLDARDFAALGRLKQILLGGEGVPASLVARIREVFTGALYNMYGPTETTIWSTAHRIEEATSPVPIGQPILNTQVFLLDEHLVPAAEGEAAELFIGGDGVARGYWRHPELTAARFLRMPAHSPWPVYRTGDLARRMPDGNLEFLGRSDHQIKLRGHRIEPGEIEALLERLPGVNEAVVVLREDKPGDPRLTAFLTARHPVPPAAAELKSLLADKLPDVMVPSAFHFLTAVPLTHNGKIDRKALLQLPVNALSPQASDVNHSTENEMERVVSQAWKDALGLAAVGLQDNFFDLGAHSLTVAEVQAALQNALGRGIPLIDLYQYPSVTALACHLSGTASPVTASAAAQRAQRRKQARGR